MDKLKELEERITKIENNVLERLNKLETISERISLFLINVNNLLKTLMELEKPELSTLNDEINKSLEDSLLEDILD